MGRHRFRQGPRALDVGRPHFLFADAAMRQERGAMEHRLMLSAAQKGIEQGAVANVSHNGAESVMLAAAGDEVEIRHMVALAQKSVHQQRPKKPRTTRYEKRRHRQGPRPFSEVASTSTRTIAKRP